MDDLAREHFRLSLEKVAKDIDKKIKQMSTTLDKKLKILLGPTFGGPSISYDYQRFVIYEWKTCEGDPLPSDTHILAEGKTIEELIENYEATL